MPGEVVTGRRSYGPTGKRVPSARLAHQQFEMTAHRGSSSGEREHWILRYIFWVSLREITGFLIFCESRTDPHLQFCIALPHLGSPFPGHRSEHREVPMSLNSEESESGLHRLLQRAASGSDSGLGELLESFRASMLAFAGRRIGGQFGRRISSSDVVLETMLTARETFTSFRGTHPVEFQKWLHRLLYSTLVDGVRRHRTAEKRRTDREDEASVGTIIGSAPTPSRVASDNEQAARLLQALQQLPEEDRLIVQFRYLENWSFEQIATALGVSVATAWRRFQETTERVHQSLRRNEDEQ